MQNKKKNNIDIGSWIGPNTICYLLSESVETSDYKEKINIEIFNNNMIIRNHIISIPNLIFMPLRLGIENIENIYYHQLFILFTYQNFVGFIGGNGSKAYYFVAIDNNFDIYYIDPHYTQDINNEVTYITDNLYKINIKDIDPSLALCFSIKDQEEYKILCDNISRDFQKSFLDVKGNENNKKITVDENNDWMNIFLHKA
jgi:cysteine protease ATG4